MPRSKCYGVATVAAILALAVLARLPYLWQTNLSPDAADYINIARNIAQGRGLIHSIKWHFFTHDPAVHSAIGERPLLYPLLLVPFCQGDSPARACQYATTAMALVALVLAAAWARRLGLNWRVVAIAVAMLAFNPGLAMASVYPWSEPLYLALLFGVLLTVGRNAGSRGAARRAALLTALAYLTRPSAGAIVLGLSAWYLWRRAFSPLIHYLITLIVLLAPWWAIVWITRGSPFYSVQHFHLVVEDIRDGMAAGYGVVFPRPLDFFFTHAPAILTKIGIQTALYAEQLFGSSCLSLLSAFVFLRLFPNGALSESEAGSEPEEPKETSGNGPAYSIALFHFILPDLIWATFDGLRFLLPVFAILVIPAVAAMDRLLGRLATTRLRVAAWVLVLGFIALFYFDQWGTLYERVTAGRRTDLAKRIARMELDRLVAPNAVLAADDPFSTNYYFDRPVIVLPEVSDSPERLKIFEQFLTEYHPDHLLLKPEEVKSLSPLLAARRLQPTGSLDTLDLQVLRVSPQ